MPFVWKDMIVISLIPAIVAFPLSYLKLNYMLAIAMTLGLSYVIFFKLHVMNKEDVQDSLLRLPWGSQNHLTSFGLNSPEAKMITSWSLSGRICALRYRSIEFHIYDNEFL